jgi:hypothetical protein
MAGMVSPRDCPEVAPHSERLLQKRTPPGARYSQTGAPKSARNANEDKPRR